jgi:hypothetical protein
MKVRFFFARGLAGIILPAGALFVGSSICGSAALGQAAATGKATPSTPPGETTPAMRDIVGTWQGTLHVAAMNRDLRIVNKITKDDKGVLKVMD